jgi:YidC/Oxa1 family membrane protein insertase
MTRRLRLLFAACLLAITALGLVAVPALAADPTGSPLPAGAAASPDASTPPGAETSPAPAATAACPIPDPYPTAAPGQTELPRNLCPAQPKGTDPVSLFAWIFTPIFQVIFMALALLYNIVKDIGLAIILVTILIRLLLVPVFRAQIVSQRRMQMLQPELRAIGAKYKGNRAKISEEQMKLYRERGYNPAAGCLPAILQLVLLLPMYQVFSQGLSAPDISSMLQIFGNPVIHVTCQVATDPSAPVPCIDPLIRWLLNTDAHVPEVLFRVFGFGISLLAIVSALLQLVQTRMMQTVTDDPQVKSQQRIFLILPLFSLIYGGLLPAGLFIYWITTTIFSIVQQYLIAGWGGLFPIFGWTPWFARNHQPRFPIPPMTPRVQTQTAGPGAQPGTRRSATDSAAGTIKPARTRARTSRRGRRR